MNKFILNIKLKQNYGLDISIIYWDQRFLWTNNNPSGISYDFYEYDNFMLYSFCKGYIVKNQFVIPEKKYYEKNYKISHEFINDSDRHDFLKKLYYCLNGWGQELNNRLRNKEKIYNEHIIVNGQFWLM